VPFFTYAQTLRDLGRGVVDFLNRVAVFVMALAVVFFVIGVIRFIATAGDDQSRVAGKQQMIWGVISLSVMVSVWGIVQIIRTTFFGP
jgi:hypothetical protein